MQLLILTPACVVISYLIKYSKSFNSSFSGTKFDKSRYDTMMMMMCSNFTCIQKLYNRTFYNFSFPRLSCFRELLTSTL